MMCDMLSAKNVNGMLLRAPLRAPGGRGAARHSPPFPPMPARASCDLWTESHNLQLRRLLMSQRQAARSSCSPTAACDAESKPYTGVVCCTCCSVTRIIQHVTRAGAGAAPAGSLCGHGLDPACLLMLLLARSTVLLRLLLRLLLRRLGGTQRLGQVLLEFKLGAVPARQLVQLVLRGRGAGCGSAKWQVQNIFFEGGEKGTRTPCSGRP